MARNEAPGLFREGLSDTEVPHPKIQRVKAELTAQITDPKFGLLDMILMLVY